jgi:hypothetical protein
MYQPMQYPCVNCSSQGSFLCSTCVGRGYIYVNPVFGSERSDGFVRKGEVRLKRTYSRSYDKFVLYTNSKGVKHVKVGKNYLKVEGTGTIEIDNITYNKLGED